MPNSDEPVVVQRGLLKSLYNITMAARDQASQARQKATLAENECNKIIRQMIHAGLAPTDDPEDKGI